MITAQMRDTVFAYLGPLKTSRKQWKFQNCKLCHTQGHGVDRKSRFGIMVEANGSIIVNCFNCGFKAIWKPGEEITSKFKLFLTTIGIPEKDIQKLVFATFKTQPVSLNLTSSEKDTH